MQSLHNNLRKLMPWYDEWHNHPRHKHAHWFILFGIGLLLTTIVFSQILSIYFGNSINANAAPGDLPNATHQIQFGYYKADSNYGNFSGEVSSYINTQLIEQQAFMRPPPDFNPQGFRDALQRTINNGQNLWVEMWTLKIGTPAEKGANWNAALDILSAYWNSIDVIYLADEPGWDKAATEAVVNEWKNRLSSRGLASKPIAINFTDQEILNQTGYQATNLDIVGIEAYVDPSSQNNPSVVSLLNTSLDQQISRVGSRQKFIVIQGYNRNGNWTNINSLKSIQTPAYLKAYNNPSVIGLFIFSHGREDATIGAYDSRSLDPCIKTEHKRIWGAISGTAQPTSIACSGSTSTIQLAPILSSWTEPTGNGWWPHLSPDGKYVSYGNNSSKITDIATKQTWDFSSTGPQCYGAYWLNSTKATFTCSTGNTTADRYEVMAGVWNAVKTSANPSLVAGNKFEANNDH